MNVNTWNKTYPAGHPVVVRMDDGTELETNTRCSAWALGDRTPVVMVEGISGGYLLSRVTPL